MIPSMQRACRCVIVGAALVLGACGDDAPSSTKDAALADVPASAPIANVEPGISAEQAAALLRDAAHAKGSAQAAKPDAASSANASGAQLAQGTGDALPDAAGSVPVNRSVALTEERAAPRSGIFARRPIELPPAEIGAWAGMYTNKDQLTKLTLAQKQSFAEAGKAFLQRDFASALERVYTLLEAQPDFPPALLMLGATYYKLRRYEDSIVAHERFLVQAPDQIGSTQALGHCYYGLGRYEQALAHYAKVVEQSPKSPEALRGLALSKMRLGDLDGALADLRRVLEISPDHADAQSFIAQVLYDQGSTEDALKEARRATELAPSDPRAYYLISRCLSELGDDEGAAAASAKWKDVAAAAEEARGIEAKVAYRTPESYPLALRLVEIYTQHKDVAKLCETLDLVAQLRPADVPEYHVRILALDALERTGDRDAAARAAQVLEQTCAEHVETWKRLESWFQANGDRKGQVRAGEKWRRLNNAGPR